MNELRHAVVVRCPIEHAFRVFTEQVDAWWPTSHRRLEGSRVALEAGVGGRLAERADDGSEHELGRVSSWDPPHSVALAWRLGAPPDAPTLVRISFTPAGEHTRVEVVHTEGPVPLPDWSQTVRIFDKAWKHVLACFGEAAEG